MKAERISKSFEPIEIKITLDTKEEAKTLYSLFNHAGICILARPIDGDAIKTAIGDEFYSEDYHHKLCDKIREEIK